MHISNRSAAGTCKGAIAHTACLHRSSYALNAAESSKCKELALDIQTASMTDNKMSRTTRTKTDLYHLVRTRIQGSSERQTQGVEYECMYARATLRNNQG
jgi:hypothetical protein